MKATEFLLSLLQRTLGIPSSDSILMIAAHGFRDLFFLTPGFLLLAFGLAAALGERRHFSLPAQIEEASEHRLVVIMCLFAAAAATVIAGGIYRWGLINSDSASHLIQAHTFSAGRIWAETPQPSESFDTIEVLHINGRMFSKYFPGTGFVFLPAVLIGQPWIIIPVIAFANTYITYRLGRLLYGKKIALTGCLFLVLSPYFLFNSAMLLSHIPCLLFTNLALFLAVRFAKKAPTLWMAILAGMALGGVFLTRPLSGLAVGFSLGVTLVLSGKLTLRTFIAGAVGLMLCIGLLALYQYVTLGIQIANGYYEYWPYDRLGFGKAGIGTDNGPHYFTYYTALGALKNTWLRVKILNYWLFGWPISSLILLVFPFFRKRPLFWDLVLLSVPLSLSLAYAFYWYEGSNEAGPSYLIPSLSAFVLLSAKGLSDLKSWLVQLRWGSILSRTVNLTIMLFFASSLAVFVPFVSRTFAVVRDILIEPKRTVEKLAPDKALVFVSYRTCYNGIRALGLPHPFTANDPFLQGDVIFALDRGDAENTTLMQKFPGWSVYRLLCATVPSRLLGTTHYHPAKVLSYGEDFSDLEATEELSAMTRIPLPRSRVFEWLYMKMQLKNWK